MLEVVPTKKLQSRKPKGKRESWLKGIKIIGRGGGFWVGEVASNEKKKLERNSIPRTVKVVKDRQVQKKGRERRETIRAGFSSQRPASLRSTKVPARLKGDVGERSFAIFHGTTLSRRTK